MVNTYKRFLETGSMITGPVGYLSETPVSGFQEVAMAGNLRTIFYVIKMSFSQLQPRVTFYKYLITNVLCMELLCDLYESFGSMRGTGKRKCYYLD